MTIYQKIKRIAKPVVEFYHDDLLVHDRRALRNMKRGETAVWSCRVTGTHMVWLARHEDTLDATTVEKMRNALNWFDAMVSTQGDDQKWHLLEKIGETVTSLTASQARQLFVDRIRAVGAAVKRLAA